MLDASLRIATVLTKLKRNAESLDAYRKALVLAQRMANGEPQNLDRQVTLSLIHDAIGDLQRQQGDLPGALQSYKNALALRTQLAQSDPANANRQSDLALACVRVAEVQMDQHDLRGALEFYSKALDIRKQVAQSQPANPDAQSNVALSEGEMGRVLSQQGDYTGALRWFRDSLAILQSLTAAHNDNTQWRDHLQEAIARIGGIAYGFLLKRDFIIALQAADEAIALAPDQIWIYTNRAHALMFLGRTDEARATYLKYRGVKDVQNGKSWRAVILEDFADLRKHGLTNPLMEEIEKLFTLAG